VEATNPQLNDVKGGGTAIIAPLPMIEITI
jgi:hypothetical protein